MQPESLIEIYGVFHWKLEFFTLTDLYKTGNIPLNYSAHISVRIKHAKMYNLLFIST